MDTERFINEAIATGQRLGVATLDPDQRLVYLIAEAECLCAMEGIDSFLDRYAEWLPETAAAFQAVGATEIASELLRIPQDALFTGDPRLDRVNGLINERVGYSYDAIVRVIADRRTRLWPPLSRRRGGSGETPEISG
jgi:hypothetical protein